MSQLRALPVSGEVFLDARGEGRLLRVTWHPGETAPNDREPSGNTSSDSAPSGSARNDRAASDVVVLSLWRGEVCTGTFRLERSDVPAFVDALVDGLAGGRVPRPRSPGPGLEETDGGSRDCRAG